MGLSGTGKTITSLSFWTITLATISGIAQGSPTPPDPASQIEQSALQNQRDQDGQRRPALPRGRAIGATSRGACLDFLHAYNVAYEVLDQDDAPGVAVPVRLQSSVGGVAVTSPNRASINEVLDCRLILALLVWSEDFEEAGIVGIEHISTYRPGARVRRAGTVSGHARAMAIDIARFRRSDGTVLDVEELWSHARRGQAPCLENRDEGADLSSLRGLVCTAVEDEIFQIVLTPHFDAPHRNHVHFELRPDVDWTYVR